MATADREKVRSFQLICSFIVKVCFISVARRWTDSHEQEPTPDPDFSGAPAEVGCSPARRQVRAAHGAPCMGGGSS